MITDANFKVYLVTLNGEKHSIQPNRNAVEALYEQFSGPKSCFEETGEQWDFTVHTITTNNDLAYLLEDDVDDKRLEAWEKASLTGKITESLD